MLRRTLAGRTIAAIALPGLLVCVTLAAQEAQPERFGRPASPSAGTPQSLVPDAPFAREVDGETPSSKSTGEKNEQRPPYAQTTHALVVDGRQRTFVVQAPEQPRGPLPVVFLFHGGGGRGENMAAVGFREMVARENFLAVYPTGWKNNWNDGRNAARIASQREGVDDVRFVRSIVEDLARRHRIDRSRIFAAGVSNGGIFCHYLAAHAADLFAAIAPVIGGLAEPVAPSFEPSRPISLLVIQGEADPLVPIGGGPIARRDRGGRIISTEDMLRLYVRLNGITGEPVEEALPDSDPGDGCRVTVRRYPPGKEGAKVEYWLVRGGGHTLPGNRRVQTAIMEAFVGKTCRDFDALEVVWRFFKSCPSRVQPAPRDAERALPSAPPAAEPEGVDAHARPSRPADKERP